MLATIDRQQHRKNKLPLSDPSYAVRETMEHFRLPAARKNIRIKSDLESGVYIRADLPAYLEAFRRVMEEIIALSPESTMLHISFHVADRRLLLKALNFGLRLSPEEQRILLQPGTALAACRDRLESMGGTIRYEQSIERGGSLVIAFDTMELKAI